MTSDQPTFEFWLFHLLDVSSSSSYIGSVSLGFLIHKEACKDNNLPQVVARIKWENLHKTSNESDSLKLLINSGSLYRLSGTGPSSNCNLEEPSGRKKMQANMRLRGQVPLESTVFRIQDSHPFSPSFFIPLSFPPSPWPKYLAVFLIFIIFFSSILSILLVVPSIWNSLPYPHPLPVSSFPLQAYSFILVMFITSSEAMFMSRPTIKSSHPLILNHKTFFKLSV